MTTFHTSKFPVLIIGGTGKTGRRVAERLTAQGVPVRIGSRSASPAFDWENPRNLGNRARMRLGRLHHLLSRPRRSRRCRSHRRSRPPRRPQGRQAPRAPLGPRRTRSPARRADIASLRRRLDHCPRQLVHAELQRKHAARPDPRRRDGAAGQHACANPSSMPMISPISSPPHSPMTAISASSMRSPARACLDLRRGHGRDCQGHRAHYRLRHHHARRNSCKASNRNRFPPISPRSSTSSSPWCSTGATNI